MLKSLPAKRLPIEKSLKLQFGHVNGIVFLLVTFSALDNCGKPVLKMRPRKRRAQIPKIIPEEKIRIPVIGSCDLRVDLILDFFTPH